MSINLLKRVKGRYNCEGYSQQQATVNMLIQQTAALDILARLSVSFSVLVSG